MKAGFLIGLLHIILIGILVMTVNLYIAEICLRTKTKHQLTGYASIYLGTKGKFIMLLAFIFGIYSALLAYLIGEGESLSFLFFNNSNYSLLFALIFWAVLSGITHAGLKNLKKGEEAGVFLILFLIIILIGMFFNDIEYSNLSYMSPENLFLPFGVVLFALLGFAAIPEANEILQKDRAFLKKSIIFSYLSVLSIYIIFTIVVLGSQGQSTPQIATLSLGKIFILLGIFAMFTSYLSLSFALIETLKLDFNLSHKKSWLITSITPLLIYLILVLTNSSQFTKILGIGGAISGTLSVILILLTVRKAKKFGKRKPEFSRKLSLPLMILLIAIFTIGSIIEIISLFR